MRMKTFAAAVSILSVATMTSGVFAQVTINDICHVKGQEENTLQGTGIVVGLNGTGDGAAFAPTLRALAKTMTAMRVPLGEKGMADLKNAKNVALVSVTATVPASGSREGDKLNCQIASIGAAKDLTGGRLLLTPMIGPDLGTGQSSPRVYAFAQGPVSLDNPNMTTTAKIHDGCRMEENLTNAFIKDGKITLVLKNNQASFELANYVAEQINGNDNPLSFESRGQRLATALDSKNIVVTVLDQYLNEDPVLFVSQILNLPLREMRTEARVVINERAGTIVFGGNVTIGAGVVTHKNVIVETGAGAGQFVGIDPEDPESPKLKALVEALNAVHVSAEDMIDIIKTLDRSGTLHGHLIIE